MSRPPTIPAEKKIRIVLSVLRGEISIAGGPSREGVRAGDRELEAPVPRGREDRH